jgi:hypothetical protein
MKESLLYFESRLMDLTKEKICVTEMSERSENDVKKFMHVS